jgi:uncharacterized caspase-like protein
MPKKIYLLFVLLCNCQFPLWATGTTYAVIVGVSNYENFSYGKGDLRYSSRDAQLFYNYMVSTNGGKIPINQTILLTNEQATKSSIIDALAIFEKANEEDRVIFFFSGHGSNGKFLPYDTDGKTPMLTHKELKQAFRQSKSKNKICIADACFAGSIQKKAFPSAQTEPTDTTHHLQSERNVLLFLACLPNQTSIEYKELKQGVFTYYLLKGFLGSADENQDQIITAFEIYKYVSSNVKEYARKKHPDIPPQTPMMFGTFAKELPLIQNSP